MLDFLHYSIWVLGAGWASIVGTSSEAVEVDGLSIRGCLHMTIVVTYQAHIIGKYRHGPYCVQ